jgi:membrane protein DedA with SNARE-associated domain
VAELDRDRARPRPTKLQLRLVVGLLAVLVTMSIAGDLLTTTLADTHPLLLITLNSRIRILVLTTNELDALSYYGVATARLLVSDPLFFTIGMWYGDGAIRWVERKSPSWGDMLRMFERGFSKAAYALVFAAPNNIICLLAGASGMAPLAFVLLNVSGTFARLYAIRVLGATFESPIDTVLDFFKEYRIPLLIASAVLVTLSVLSDRRKGGGDIEIIHELEEELEED